MFQETLPVIRGCSWNRNWRDSASRTTDYWNLSKEAISLHPESDYESTNTAIFIRTDIPWSWSLPICKKGHAGSLPLLNGRGGVYLQYYGDRTIISSIQKRPGNNNMDADGCGWNIISISVAIQVPLAIHVKELHGQFDLGNCGNQKRKCEEV